MKTKANSLAALRHLAASELAIYWPQIKQSVHDAGPVVVTSGPDPAVVILSAEDYEQIVARLTALERMAEPSATWEAKLTAIQQQFDERLASLNAPDAGDRLRSIMQAPAQLEGQVKAGTDF